MPRDEQDNPGEDHQTQQQKKNAHHPRNVDNSNTNIISSPLMVPVQVLASGKTTNSSSPENRRKQRGGRRKKKLPPKKEEGDAPEEGEAAITGTGTTATAAAATGLKAKASKKSASRKKNQSKQAPPSWRSHISKDVVDPITLDPLYQLKYPPFALKVSPPYEPVLHNQWWDNTTVESSMNRSSQHNSTPKGKAMDDREQQILQEQWGSRVALPSVQGEEEKDSNTPVLVEQTPATQKNNYNLFDGRALAYWMVSSNQFMDPLNRRDLTRDELLALDQYLQQITTILPKKKKKNAPPPTLRVTEAYDVKGVSLSTAGAAATTAAGRATILQEEARNLLQALFVSHTSRGTNRLANQYNSYEQSNNSSRHQPRGTNTRDNIAQEDVGIYGDQDGGIILIDDDLNPGLRGSAPAFVPASSSLYSASHIAARHSHTARLQQEHFPSLGDTAAANSSSITDSMEPSPSSTSNSRKKELPKFNTLSKIAKTVKKTDPAEIQKQFEAREAARRKAMMANLTFGQPAVLMDHSTQPPNNLQVPTRREEPSDGQLERNRRLADALGVAPATVRNPLNSGWARPTSRDDFGEELKVTTYPDSLIMRARDRMPLVLKVEKKWLKFLQDDTSASLPLSRMDKPTRIFVHHYSDFWFLHTQSFDPEPYRYIHCVKTRETCAPYPLLSDAVRRWTGPSIIAPVASLKSDHAQSQTTGQSTDSRLATSISDDEVEPVSSLPGRQKLQLQKRTLPLELPPVEHEATYNLTDDLENQRKREEEKKRKQQEKDEARRRALEAAFASESEDSESEWEEQEPLYQSDDESTASDN